MRRNWQKGMLIVLGTLLFVGGARSTAHAVAACGDLNNSTGAPNSLDVIALAQAVGGTHPSPGTLCGGSGPVQCGDLVQNGSVLPNDLVALLQVAAGVETLLTPCTGFGPVIACGTNRSGTISANEQWPAGCDTFVDGTLLVNPGVVLTVQPGASVKGRKTSSNGTPSVLVILRDAKINAAGTDALPIVMSSDQTPGSRAPQDWGGLLINGRAPVNFPGGQGSSEGLPPGVANFGGNEPNDSSGQVRFTRIEFSGIEFSPDNELNVFTMNALGRGTTIDHVQANAGSDDCHEWFGGTVRAKNLVATSCVDDFFDWQIGFTGAVQFGLAYQNAANATGSGRNGFESDNNELGFDLLPRSNPTFCNMTVIGRLRQGGASTGAAANLRRGTAGKISNSILMDWPSAGLDLDNDESIANGCVNGTTLNAVEPVLRVQDTILHNNGAGGAVQVTGSTTAPNCTPTQLYGLWAATEGLVPASPTTVGTDPLPTITATFPTVVDGRYFPASGGIADGAPDCEALLPEFFDSAPYIGAFLPGGTSGDNWLITSGGWISFAIN